MVFIGFKSGPIAFLMARVAVTQSSALKTAQIYMVVQKLQEKRSLMEQYKFAVPLWAEM